MKMKILAVLFSLIAVSMEKDVRYEEIHIEDKDYWKSIGSRTLDDVLQRKINNNIAKNVILFVGDGMGLATTTAARIYQGQTTNNHGESNVLSFENFPSVGLIKTYNVDKQVPDSASTATAMFSGVKTKYYVVGLDAIASFNSCNPEVNKRAKVSTIMNWAQEKGKDTGIVTTTKVTHATPAAAYAHTNNRDWECDSTIPQSDMNCVKDIARQLVEDEPGRKFKVILGGGRKQFGDFKEFSNDDTCSRKDQRNLTSEWLKNKRKAKYVTTAEELSHVDANNTDYLLGLFAPGHLNYVGENNTARPSLKNMTKIALEILQKNDKGYFLMVEGGKIDLAHHKNYARLALMEAVEFDEAIALAINMTKPEETLIIVTADHSHSMTMNGYPLRGSDILGLARDNDKIAFETLTYANGPGFDYHLNKNNTNNCKGSCSEAEKASANLFRDVRNDTSRYSNIYYQNHATFYLSDDTHGGEDVAIYASGPKSHLLVGVHEQNYIANVISYAACVGPEAHRCLNEKISHNLAIRYFPDYVTLFILIFSILLAR